MFPKNQYNTEATLFTPCRDAATNNIRFFRCALYRCFRNAAIHTTDYPGGTAAPEKVELHIPLSFNAGYVSPCEWQKLTALDIDLYWTVRIGGDDINRSVIIQGDILYPALEQWQSIEESERGLSAFARDYNGRLFFPSEVEEILFGPMSMRRIVCKC